MRQTPEILVYSISLAVVALMRSASAPLRQRTLGDGDAQAFGKGAIAI